MKEIDVLKERESIVENSGEKIRMTFEEYDKMVDEFQYIQVKAGWPGPDEMDIIQSDIQRFLPYVCYVDEFGKEPRTKDEEYRKKTLRMFLREHLELVDEEVSA